MKTRSGIVLLVVAVALRVVAQTPPAGTNAADLPPEFNTNAEPKVVQPAQIDLSPALAEVVRLAQTGVDEKVIVAYVEKAPAYSVSAEEIIYLRDLGIPDAVVTSVVEHGKASEATGNVPSTPATPAPPATNIPSVPQPTQVVPPSAPPAAVVTPPLTPPETVAEFYQPLSPYGTWVNVDPYGWCWQPNVVVVNAGWNPYCDNGYWMWSDSGWYWHSYYSWGWAPFHYGRWFYHPHRHWVWAPDRVWGPSWVCWRETPGYYGWAPLPPGARFSVGIGWTFGGHHVGSDFAFGISSAHFTFVAGQHFADHRLTTHRLPPREVNVVYNKTTVINNYVVGSNNRIVNRGVDRGRVEAATGSRIHEVTVKEMPRQPARANAGVMPDRVTKEGRSDIVYKPGPKIEVPRKEAPIARGPREVPTHPNLPGRIGRDNDVPRVTPTPRATSPQTVVPQPDAARPAPRQPGVREPETPRQKPPQTVAPQLDTPKPVPPQPVVPPPNTPRQTAPQPVTPQPEKSRPPVNPGSRVITPAPARPPERVTPPPAQTVPAPAPRPAPVPAPALATPHSVAPPLAPSPRIAPSQPQPSRQWISPRAQGWQPGPQMRGSPKGDKKD